MNKLLFQIAAAAVVVMSFSVSAVNAQASGPTNTGGGFQPLPKSCPVGKSARIIYDQKGAPVGVVCV